MSNPMPPRTASAAGAGALGAGSGLGAGGLGSSALGGSARGAMSSPSVSAPPVGSPVAPAGPRSAPNSHAPSSHAPTSHTPYRTPPAGPSSSDGGRRSRTVRRPPRLASLQLKRVDPWTVLKISLIVAIVMFFVWMIAVGVLYLSLGSMDVWSKINSTYNTLVVSSATDSTSAAQPDLITPARIFGVTAVIGAVNIVLFTALATIAAFVYNAAAGMAGGVEVTLGERD